MDKYNEIRIAVFLRGQGKCAICGKELYWKEVRIGIPTITLQSDANVHHIDKNRENNSLDNLMLLCGFCHMSKFHRKKRKNLEMRQLCTIEIQNQNGNLLCR